MPEIRCVCVDVDGVLTDGRIFMVTYLVDEAPTAYIRGYYFAVRDFYLG